MFPLLTPVDAVGSVSSSAKIGHNKSQVKDETNVKGVLSGLHRTLNPLLSNAFFVCDAQNFYKPFIAIHLKFWFYL